MILLTKVGVIQIVNRVSGFSKYSELLAMSRQMAVNRTNASVDSLDALEIMKSSSGRDKYKTPLDIIRLTKKESQE